MTKARILLVGTFEKEVANWQDDSLANQFNLVKCRSGFDALAKLNEVGAEALIISTSISDLSAKQLCCLLKGTESTSLLPIIAIGNWQNSSSEDLPEFFTKPDLIFSTNDLNEKSFKLISHHLEAAKNLGWRGEPAKFLPLAPQLSTGFAVTQGHDTLLNDLLIERVVGKAARSLTFAVEPHKRFLQAYFSTIQKLIDADLYGIALGGLQNSWLALHAKVPLNQSAIDELIDDIKSKLSLTEEPSIDLSLETINNNHKLGEKHFLFLQTGTPRNSLLLFVNVAGKKFTRTQLAILPHLQLQLESLMHILSDKQEIEKFHTRQTYNSSSDPLTGLYNLQFLLGFLQQQLLFSARNKLPVGLLMINIDNFAEINASIGTQKGDVILMKLAGYLLKSTRTSDLSARYSGDEFAIVLPNTDVKGTTTLAEKLRSQIEKMIFFDNKQEPQPKVTVSIGCAQFDSTDLNPEIILEKAQVALELAQEKGGNLVT